MPVNRPAPKPPVEKRPRSLSVTRIETLRRDPYAIYAERILKLQPSRRRSSGRSGRARRATPGTRRSRISPKPSRPARLPAEARAALVGFARGRFAALLETRPSRVSTGRTSRRRSTSSSGSRPKAAARSSGSTSNAWACSNSRCAMARRSRLTARADRIDSLADGEARLIDYKSGMPPSKREVTIGLAPQLTLEAAILAKADSPISDELPRQQALYLKLGGPDGGRRAMRPTRRAARRARRPHLADLKVLLNQFADPDTPYLSRPMPKFASRFADYDHLARVKEWSLAGGAGEARRGTRHEPPPRHPGALRNQALASDPNASIWVSANAGSGKTHVLTQRVLRLLLDGAKPAQILGLTFTKAAAANMAGRIFTTLAEWTSLDDEALTQHRQPARPARASRRSPSPGNCSPARSRRRAASRFRPCTPSASGCCSCFRSRPTSPRISRWSTSARPALMTEAATSRALGAFEPRPRPQRRSISSRARPAHSASTGCSSEALGLPRRSRPSATPRASQRRCGAARPRRTKRPPASRPRCSAATSGADAGWPGRRSSPPARPRIRNSRRRSTRLTSTDRRGERPALLDAFFTKGGEGDPRGGAKRSSHRRRLRDKLPGLEEDLQREQARLTALRDKRRAAQALERSVALFAVARAILKAFAATKAERGALDFADQIARALALVDAVERRLGDAEARLRPRPCAGRRGAGQFGRAVAHRRGADRGVLRRRGRASGRPAPYSRSATRNSRSSPSRAQRLSCSARCGASSSGASRGADAVRARAAQFLLPLGARHPRGGRHDVRSEARGGASRRRRAAARARGDPHGDQGRSRNLADGRRREAGRTRRLADAARRTGRP